MEDGPLDCFTQIRRLGITLALKEAYFRAVGKRLDYNDVQFDIFNKTTYIPSASVNGFPLQGWEFHSWPEDLFVTRHANPSGFVEKYECAVAFYRPTAEGITFVEHESPGEWRSLKLSTMDRIIDDIPHLHTVMPTHPWQPYLN